MAASELVLRRINWIRDKVNHGYCTSLTTSNNNGVTKLKFVLNYLCCDGYDQSAIIKMLEYIEAKAITHLIWDKGHGSFSRDRSVIEFWIKPRSIDAGSVQHVVQEPLGIVSNHLKSDDCPPVPPPPLPLTDVKLDQMMLQIDSIAEQLLVVQSYAHVTHQAVEHIDQLCLNVNTNTCLLYPMAQKLEETPTATAFSKLDQDVLQSMQKLERQVLDQLTNVENVNKRALNRALPDVQNVAMVFSSIGAQTDTPCLTDASTLVTARMLQDEKIESTSEIESSDVSSEAEEEFIPVDRATLQSSRFYKVRVYNEVRKSWGKVDAMVRSAQSGEILYRVRFERGGLANFPRETIKEMVQSGTERAYDSGRTKSKSSSSRK